MSTKTNTKKGTVTTPATKEGFLSPYKAAGVVNKALEEAGVTKRIPPQMMYNYTTARVNAGKNPLIGFDPKTGVDPKSLDEWVKKYVAKQQAK